MRKRVSLLSVIIFPLLTFGQQDNWDVYIAQYEKGPGSVTLNMDLINRAPVSDLPFILITGVRSKKCDSNGFPDKSEFNNIYKISDSIISVISHTVKAELVGSFTYQCERLDYIYVKDTNSLRRVIETTYSRLFPSYNPSIKFRLDSEWKAYLEFLYPNDEIQEYMANQKVINRLMDGGDNLSKSRKVDHWIYFKTKQARDKFKTYAKDNSFKIESEDFLMAQELPYQLRISRKDNVDVASISKVTLQLRKEAIKLSGDYDGWETILIK